MVGRRVYRGGLNRHAAPPLDPISREVETMRIMTVGGACNSLVLGNGRTSERTKGAKSRFLTIQYNEMYLRGKAGRQAGSELKGKALHQSANLLIGQVW